MTAPTVDQVVERYVQLRAEKAEIAARHAEELKPLSEKMAVIENWLLNKLNTDGVDSFRTAHGTAYKSVATSMSMADKSVFMDYVMAPARAAVLEGETFDAAIAAARFDLIDLRVGKKGVQEALENGEAVPPGINVTQVTTVNIRKG